MIRGFDASNPKKLRKIDTKSLQIETTRFERRFPGGAAGFRYFGKILNRSPGRMIERSVSEFHDRISSIDTP